ncbi:MAG: hypothetical protein HQL44_07285 [Alphaproteobacteria bacterium]|nr:hypothetical protein [Alphaproteobacteria bacterium]
MMATRIKRLAILLLPLLAAACGYDMTTGQYPITSGLMQVEVVSLVATGKTATDHVASLATGKDCSTIRAKDEGQFCVSRNPPIQRPDVYCYRTLGQVSCYREPDPYGDGAQAVGVEAYNRQPTPTR